MRVVLISGANSIHTVKWANALAARSNDVYVISCPNHKFSENRFSGDVEVKYLKYKAGKGYYLNARELRRFIKEINPDVINVHYASGYGTLARKAKIGKYLLNVWGSDVYDFPNESFIKKIILKKNLKSAYMIASTSNCMAEETKKYTDKKIYITPFGVDTKKFYPLNLKKNELILGTVKTLDTKYGIEYLIKGVNELIKRGYKDFEYHIYGNGPKKEEYLNLIRDLKLENIVFLKGYCPNDQLNSVINNFTISIFGSVSESESFGVAAVESMACGIPVIASNVAGFNEVIVNGKTGLIYERKNYSKLADLIESLAFKKENYDSIATAGRNRVIELYDWNKNVDEMLKIYSLLER